MRDVFRYAVLILGAVNVGLIAGVWSISWQRRPGSRFYVSGMAVWGILLTVTAGFVTVDRLGHLGLSWFSPVLAVSYLIGALVFGRLLREMRHRRFAS